MKKILSILKCFLPPIIALGFQSIVYYTISMIYLLVFDQSPSEEATRYMLITAIFISGIVFVIQYIRFSGNKPITTHNRKYMLRNILLISGMGITGQLFIAGTMTIISPLFIRYFSDYTETVDSINTGHPLVVVAYVVIIAPIVEELIFRWSVLDKASRVLPFMAANLLQAIAFGLFHGNMVQGFFASLLGLLLGVVYHKYQNIIAPIILHMIFNGSTYLIRLLPADLYAVILMIIVGGVFTGIILWIMLTKVVDE